MGRALRTDVGDHIYHVLNRANARLPLFEQKKDYQLFEAVLAEAQRSSSTCILRHAQPLASGGAYKKGRGSHQVRELAHTDTYPALAFCTQDHRSRPLVPRSLQVLSV